MFCGFSFAGTLTEDFNDGDMDGWTILSGTWAVTDKELHQTQAGGPMVIVWEEPGELTDFTLTVRAMGLVTNADWGLAFRVADINNHYSWQFVNGHLAFVSYVNNGRTENWTWNTAETLNEWQEFTVVAEGNSFELWWKGEKKHTFQHDALTTGKVGLFGWETSEKFDDVSVTAEGIGGGRAVSKSGKLTTTWSSIKSK